MTSVKISDTPPRKRRGAGQYPQPVALLARLGVDLDHERRGLGAGLLQDIIARTAELDTSIGCRGLLVHAESPQARDFYLYLIPEFTPSPTDDLHLLLLTKDIHKSSRRTSTNSLARGSRQHAVLLATLSLWGQARLRG